MTKTVQPNGPRGAFGRHLALGADAFKRLSLVLAVLAGLALLSILGLVGFGVIMRYVFGAPIVGVNEIVQMTAVILVMSALPICTIREEHVAVDVFETALGRWGCFLGDILSRGLSSFVLGVLCYRAVLKALDALEWGDATNMLRLPIWPVYAVLAAGAGLCALILALQLLGLLVRGVRA